MSLGLKRAYEDPSPQDGFRVLVDRLWPRGLSKEKAQVDLWLKEIAPTTELRKWFAHDPAKWAEFKGRYRAELKQHSEQIHLLRTKAKKAPVTLVYGAQDENHNNAVVLLELLKR
jgi:uncharacterized protein YeaO (DUF488 family)